MSCTDYDREEFRMEVDKKYVLKKWPDSAYIDTLDRFFANELVRHPERQRVEMTMNANVARPQEKKKSDVPQKSRMPSATQAPSAPAQESFSERFFHSLHKLLENPNNSEFGRKYRAKDGESLDDLLVRIYGSQAKKIPKHLSESMLRQLNPGANFSSLSEGEMVLLPQLK